MADSKYPLGLYYQAKTPQEYLDQRLDKSGDCWLWTKGVDKNGYGQCHATRVAREAGVTRSHQLAYVAAYGPIPEGRLVCHHCDNPTCCNPEHLYAGTPSDNVRDCVERGRWKGGSGRHPCYDEIVALHGERSCIQVAEDFGLSYSNVCMIWRANGLRGRNFHKGKLTKRAKENFRLVS